MSDGFHALGLGAGVEALASLAAFLSFTALSLFFLLKDGPLIRRWVERHMGVPYKLDTITGRTLQSLRGYFVGVTAVAVFDAVVIGLGALVLDVPQLGAIVIINFVAAYIPYLGAWYAASPSWSHSGRRARRPPSPWRSSSCSPTAPCSR